MSKSLLLVLALIGTWPETHAQQSNFIRTEINSLRIAFGTGPNAQRVGNAVLLRIHSQAKDADIGFTSKYLAACDASWISGQINTSIHKGPWSPERFETEAKEEEEAVPLDVVEFQNWRDTKLYFAPNLRLNIVSICKASQPEPRNVHIPIASYAMDGKKPGATISLLTGTAARKGTTVDIWLRATHSKTVPMLGADGQPIVFKGVEQQKHQPVGSYVMQRTAFDCGSRQLATYQTTEYNESGGITDSWSIPREGLKFSDAVPDSVGDAQVDVVCRVYGAR